VNRKSELKGTFCVFMAAFIWGYAVVAQKNGTEFLGPFTFTGFRCLMGSMVVLPIMLFFNRKKTPEEKCAENNPKILVLGSLLGGILVASFNTLQQTGLAYTDAGKSAFITALYILFVPIFGLFMKQHVAPRIWVCVAIALTGFYVMCMTEGISAINKGDLFVLAGTVLIAVHMYVIDYMVTKTDALKFNCLQFFVAGIIGSTIALIWEQPTIEAVMNCAFPLLYAGFISSGLGYLFQVVGQKYLNPAKTSLILSSESVFALFSGMIFLHEILTGKEYIGCAMIFAAILLSQIEPKKKNIN